MASLTHALLTEDEAVLLEALEPSSGDRILALFARGNGDAALSLLQGDPSVVLMLDLFDQRSLAAQFEFKQWLFRRLDNPTLRAFLGVTEGCTPSRRDSILAAALSELSPSSRAFWRARRNVVLNGMARSDSTAVWCRTLDRFLATYSNLPVPLRTMSVRLGRWLAPFYFPREERRHSLGYRQLMADAVHILRRFIAGRRANGRRTPSSSERDGWGEGQICGNSRLFARARPDRAMGHSLIRYTDFRYLSSQGQAAVLRNLDRGRFLDHLPAPLDCNKIYLSNVIDYLPADGFHSLLCAIAPKTNEPCRAFLNSSFDSSDAHPHLARGIHEGLFRIDADRTARLRAMDRVGVYPGLTVIHLEGAAYGL